MAQRTRREATRSFNLEQDAMARELYGRKYTLLNEEEAAAVDTALSAEAPEGPTSGTSEPSGTGDLPTEDPTADTPTAGSNDTGGDAADPSAPTTPDSAADAESPGSSQPEANASGQPANTVTTAEVREWAQSRFQVPSHGRLTSEARDAYLAEHPGITIVTPPGKTSKPLIPVPDDVISFEEVPEGEWESHPLSDGPTPRDPAQIRFDDRVKAVHDKWIAAGRPEVRKAPRDRIAVDPKYGPAIRRMLGSAATHHKVQVKVQPVSHDQHGRQVIVFTAIDKPTVKVAEKPKPKPAAAE
jgi:hypothetical protein